jgi:hypothetical protein
MIYHYELMTLAHLRELRTQAMDEARQTGCTSLDLVAIERQIARKEAPPRAIRPQSLARERYEQAWQAKERMR